MAEKSPSHHKYAFPPFIKNVSKKSTLVIFPINGQQEAAIPIFHLAFRLERTG